MEIDLHVSLDVVKQAYPEAVQSVRIDRTPNNARNHRPVRVFVPLWESNLLGPFRGVFFESGVKSLGIGEQANKNAA